MWIRGRWGCVLQEGDVHSGSRWVTYNLHTYCTLYCVYMVTSGHNQRAAAVADAIGMQQVKGCNWEWQVSGPNLKAGAEGDTIRELMNERHKHDYE